MYKIVNVYRVIVVSQIATHPLSKLRNRLFGPGEQKLTLRVLKRRAKTMWAEIHMLSEFLSWRHFPVAIRLLCSFAQRPVNTKGSVN